MSLALPYPSMVFVPLDVLTADEMNHIVANYEFIANQFPITSDNIDSTTMGVGDQIWSGNLYTVGDSESISTPLVVGGVYLIEAWGLSAYYKMIFPIICGSGQTSIQQAYSDGVNSCRWRISLDTTNNTVSLDSGSQNMGTNTAITGIYRISAGH